MNQSIPQTPGNGKVFIASLLAFAILMTPIAAVAAPTRATTSSLTNTTSATSPNSAAPEAINAPLEAFPATQPMPAPEPFMAPVPPSAVTATMSAALTATANNLDGKADPGDTINYTVQLSNTSGAGATGLSFNVPIDSHTTLLPGLNSTPVAFDQSVNTNEDTGVSITLMGQDPDGSNLTFNNISVPANGTLGSFSAPSCDGAGVCSSTATYTPNANFNGADSFNFRVNDGTANSNETGVVSITVIGVNDAPTFSGSGNPVAVNEDAGAQTVLNFRTNVSPGPANESAQVVTFPITNNTNTGLFSTQPALNVSGTNVTLTYTPAANQNGTATITFHAHDNGGTANGGVDNSPDQMFTITVNAVNDAPVVTNKTFSPNAVQANMKIIGLTGLLTGVTDADTGIGSPPCNPTFTVTNVSATTPAGGTISNLNASTGTFDFDPPPGASGNVTFTYTVTDTGCPGAATSAPATVTINVAGPVIWFVNPTAVNPAPAGDGRLSNPFTRLDQATTAMGVNANQRIFVFKGFGSTVSGTGVSLVASQWLIGQGAIGTSFDTLMGITPPAATIARPTISADSTASATNRPNILGRVQMNASNTRVQGININPPAGTQALTGTNGAAMTGMQVGVSSSQSDVTVTASGISGSNAMGVSFNNAGGTFSLISVNVNQDGVNKPATGISLTNATGSFTVLGNGGVCTVATPTCTGGQIQNASGDGVLLNNVSNVSLNLMNIHHNLGNGIRGTTVNGFKINNLLITNNGDSAASDESGIQLTNLIGTAAAGANPTSITNTTIRNNWEFELQITNNSGTLTDFQMSGNTISADGTQPNHGNLVNFLGGGTSNMKLTVTSGTFTGNTDTSGGKTITGDAIGAVNQGTSHTVNVSGATFTNNNVGVNVSSDPIPVNFSFNISGNNFQGSRAVAVNSFQNGNPPFNRTVNGTIQNNTIGTAGVANSGSALGNGISISNEGAIQTANFTISGNQIHQVTNFPGISVNVGLGGAATGGGTTNLTITGNTFSNIGSRAMTIQDNQVNPAGNPGAPFPTICANVSGNTFGANILGQAGNGEFMRFRELSGTVRVTQATPTAAANAAELDDANGFNNPAKINITGGVAFSQPACTPSSAMLKFDKNHQDFASTEDAFKINSTHALLAFLNAGTEFASIADDLSNVRQYSNFGPTEDNALSSQIVARAEGVPQKSEVAKQTENSKQQTANSKQQARVDETVTKTVARATGQVDGRRQRAEGRTQKEVRSHHARQKIEVGGQRSEVRRSNAAVAPTFLSPPPGTFPVNGTGSGFSMPNGKTITITFSVTLNNPPNLAGVTPPRVTAQGTLSGAFAGNPFLTDDPTVPPNTTEHDPTVTLVDLFDTTTTLGSSPTPPWNTGQSVTFTATVASNPPGNPTAVTGTVTFKDGLNTISGCGSVAVASGQAQCTTTFTTGAHSITATYSGDGNFDPSTSNTIADSANLSGTTTAVTSSQNPSLVGQNVTFTATVSSSTSNPGPPTGTVTFKADGVAISCTNAGGQTLSAGIATCQTATLDSAGSPHTITAEYPGDSAFSSSIGSLAGGQVVNKSNTSTALTSSSNPVTPTVQVTYTATVSSLTSVTGPPTGTVTFKDGGVDIVCEAGSQALTGGVATCNFTYPDTVGSPHSITAVYSGDATFNGSTSNTVLQVVESCSASVVVTNTNDSGAGSLREAISTGVCAGGTITFDPAVFTAPGPHVIELLDGSGELLIDKDLAITGPGAAIVTVRRDDAATTQFRIFNIDNGTTPGPIVTISGLTISNGDAVNGGGIYNDHGTLTLQNLTLSGNTASGGGGAVYNDGQTSGSATLNVINSTLSSNTAPGGTGGGVHNNGTGGSAILNITGSTLNGNSAANGGAIYNEANATFSATLNIFNSTISGNLANDNGGGLYNFDAGAVATLTSVTITGNHADNDDSAVGTGGGINVAAGTVTLKNTIVAGNYIGSATTTADDIAGAINTTASASTFNLIGDAATSGGLTDGTDNNIVGNAGVGTIDITTILNTTLADNGGPTRTHALVTGSPALEKGNAFSLTTDQRGFPRPVDSDSTAPVSPFDDSDIGAFETQATPDAPGAPNLDAASDSGVNSADDKTNITTNLSFTITPVISGATVELFRDGVLVASGVASGTSIQLVDPGTGLTFDADGTDYSYTAKQSLGAGNTSVASSALVVTITIVPDAPVLDPASDTGALGDGITNDTSPTFNITNVVNTATVKLFRDGTEVASGTATGTTIQLTDPSAPNGTFTYTATQEVSSITSAPSAGTSITITIQPNAPDLIAASDSGLSSTDNITSDTSPTFDIAGVINGATVELLRDGTSVASGVAAGTTIQLTDPGPAAEGTRVYRARQTVGVTLSPDSDPLNVTIDTAAPSPATPDLQAASDTGTSDTDNRTGATPRVFTISTTETGSLVELLRNGTPVASTAGTGSSVTLSDPNALADGSYNYSTRETDAAGNTATSSTLIVTIDTTAPSVVSVVRASANPTAAASVNFTVTFSEDVTGVDITDFVTTTTGAITGTSVTSVTPVTGSVYTVAVNTGTNDGTIRLDVINDLSIKDVMNLSLAGGFATGEVYSVDRSNPSVASITRADANPTNATTVNFTVTFSEPVSGVDTGDFALFTTGVAGASVTGVTGSGATRTVTVNTGTGDGTIRLDVIDNDTIIDSESKPLGGPGLGNGNFTTGEVYTIDKTKPDVTINKASGQADPVTGPLAGTVINFTAVFTEPVSDFTTGDVNISGTAGATVVNVTGSGTTYNVAVEGMTGSGTVIVDIPADAAHDSAGNGNTVSTSTDNTVTFLKDVFTTFEVNTVADTDDTSCDPLGTGSGNQDCTLREAINAANGDSGAETITFNATVFAVPGPHVINLTGALPDLASDMTISGPGANVLTVKRNVATRFRIFTVSSGVTVNISGLLITNGFTSDGLSGGVGGVGDGGGGILNSGTLTLTGVAVIGNKTGKGGDGTLGTGGWGGSGGGILNGGTLTINNSTISGNQTGNGGNSGNGLGGFGGGIESGGTLTVTNSTISGNQTGNGGIGGIGSNGGDGGGIDINGVPTTVIGNSTITGNSTGTGTGAGHGGNGGGIRAGFGTNTIKNSIIGGNFVASGGSGPDISLTVNSEGFNLIQSTSGAIINQTMNAGTNITGQDPELFPLDDNGGPTLTHALQCTSPAIDKGNNFGVLTDQRNATRPFDLSDSVYPNAAGGDGSDIGAYETQSGGGCLPLAVTPATQVTNEDTPGVFTLTGTHSQNTPLTFTATQSPAHGTLGSFTAPNCVFTTFTTCTSTVTYTPSSNYNGPDSFKFRVSAGPGLDSDEADVNITVNPVNDAPLLDNSGTMTLGSLSASASDAFNTGRLVTEIVASAGGDRITDIDAGAIEGIAVIAVDDSNGSWQFSINNGASWTPFGGVTQANARLLASDGVTRIRFVPNSGVVGTISPAITFRAWDQTSGVNGGTANVTVNGGTTAFSVLSETADITVSPGSSILIDDVTITEGDSGTTNAVFTVSLTVPSTVIVTVNYATADGTATQPGDYQPVPGTPLTFNPGETSKTVSVAVNGDTTFEGDETFFVNLSNSVNAMIADASGLGTILDDEPTGGILRFSAATYTVGESSGPQLITVERTGNLSQAVTVDFVSSDHSSPADFIPCSSPGPGLASSRCDFTTAVGTLHFAAGQSSATFLVLISQDNYVEGTETLSLTLSNPTGGAVLGIPGVATLEITDDATEGSTNSIDISSEFVKQHYRDFLYREPDAPGLAFWTDNIEKCNDPARRPPSQTVAQCIDKQRESTATAFFLAPEFQMTGGFVYRLYKGSLPGVPDYDGSSPGRFPTYLEFLSDVRQVAEGIVVNDQISGAVVEANRDQLALDFVQRPEFLAHYGGLNNTQYVDELFNITGITPSQSDKDALVTELNNASNANQGRASVLRKVVDGTVVIAENNVVFTTTYGQAFYNQEFTRVFVLMEYLGYLRRNPDNAGFVHWLGKLNFFNGDPFQAEMVRSFILSPEYRSRFGQP